MRQTLFRHALKGLRAVALQVQLGADNCDGSFFPIVKTNLQKAIALILEENGVAIVKSGAPILIVDVRARLLNMTDQTGGLIKIETSLRESVVIARNGLTTDIDTWRHRMISGVFSGIPDPSEARGLIEAEVLRQVESFLSDADLSSPSSVAPESPISGKPAKRIEVGSIDGVPELKTEMETQCVGPPWARICSDVPVVYTRTSRVAVIAEVSAADDLFQQFEKDIKECAITAAGAVTLAVIIAGPEAALPAFKATFQPCIESKIRQHASQVGVRLKVEQQTGEWHRRT